MSVSPEEDTVWLSINEMCLLFERDQSVISRHIANIFKEGELDENTSMHFLHKSKDDKRPNYRLPALYNLDDSVHKKILYTAPDGKSYKTSFYNLDMILSVGYRVKSKRATEFRRDVCSDQLMFIDKVVDYKHWYFAHYHYDRKISDKKTCLYQEIIEISQ